MYKHRGRDYSLPLFLTFKNFMEYLDFRNLVTEACNKMIKENKHFFYS